MNPDIKPPLKVLATFTEAYDMNVRIIEDATAIYVEFTVDTGPKGGMWERQNDISFPKTAKGYCDAVREMATLIEQSANNIEEFADDEDFT